MSNFAKYEKELLFKSRSYVVCGAIEEKIFNYKPNIISDFDSFDHKVLSVCRLDKNKRVDVIIDAFSLFLQKEANSILIIIGTGSEKKTLVKKVKNLGISNNVVFLGFVDEKKLYDYYALADISVLIDWADYRITAFESLSVGTKVLMSNEADFDADMKSAGYIYLAKPTSDCVSKELEKALAQDTKIDHQTLVKKLEKYTWRHYAKNIINIMEERRAI